MLPYFQSGPAEATAGPTTFQLQRIRAAISLNSVVCCVFLFASTAFAQADRYAGKGMLDVNFSASAIIPHASASDATGLFSGAVGYFVSRGSLLEAAVTAAFNNGSQDVFLGGGYRYFFGAENSKLRPFVGAGIGGNIAHVSGLGSNSNFEAQGRAGLRYYVSQHVAVEFGYEFQYEHFSGASFSQSTQSVIVVGFAHTF